MKTLCEELVQSYQAMDIDQEYTSTSLPYDIIECILSRLPVKSLLRFKSVSKSWEATISGPRFLGTHHLQQSKNSDSQHLLMLYPYETGDCHVVKFENKEFQTVSAIEYPWENYLDLLCYCDGLLLKRFGNYEDKMYVLWNPSSRSYIKFHCPHPIDHDYKTVYGLCYDPLIKDYKVIITDMKHYALFYCRENYWTEMKVMKERSSGEVICSTGLSFDGDFYWVLTIRKEEDSGPFWVFEMVSFDSRAEKFKKVPMPHFNEDINSFNLKTLGGNLCLTLNTIGKPSDRILLMKKVGHQDSWIEFNEPLPFSGSYVVPVCSTNKNEIILDLGDSKSLRVYNLGKKTSAKVARSSTGRWFPRFVPYQENLFFQQSKEQS